ncbi:DUF2779 domain-containing protein [Litorilituus lipolyticus]|uniref:DUF2779 domain-containing protein n=1 Tax=Litorilituus lipolyticus TaxID=2491017 RepID=A0A502KWH7_9GAMM|nr:DUF2779 domain-containing protein [Litorilituus lipolyticus]TPH15866.1 DUF2779 domain-containing protein [Litorilituus lipolyticus]
MNKPRYLTKSRFKMATECPTKLYYTGKNEYPNTMLDDPFLAALADGGHQVGELAKQYYPNGFDITTLDYSQAEKQTLELLKLEEVVIFEPAIRFNNLFIRVDILVKKGNHFELIEVKAKSYSRQKNNDFINTKGKVDSTWKAYIYDVAFQKHVLKNAFPKSSVSSYLMLVDKSATCVTDGLNQKFILEKDEHNRKGITVSSSLDAKDLSSKLLTKINVDKVVELVYETELHTGMPAHSFKDNITALAKHYQEDKKISPVIGKKCKTCEFRCSVEDEQQGKLSGVKSCWQEQLRWSDKDFNDKTVLDIWNFRGADKCIEQGVIKLIDVEPEHIGEVETKNAALAPKERQWLQVEKEQNNDKSIYFDAESMQSEMGSWTFPLHFIDFETSAVAIPFYKGMSPYEGIAFQFSHHIVNADGHVEHAGEFLNTAKGEFPNFEFVRALKSQLENDQGTIFMYSSHENSYLNMIYRQLNDSNELDKEKLCEFIKTITRSTHSSKENWHGERCMVDMLELVKKYYYDPATNGSNSIKYVLPAILNSSQYLQDKYSKPIYGSNVSTGSINSLNFKDKVWIEVDEQGKVKDPYKHLPKMFTDISNHDVELLSEGDELNNGGLALTAYARLQFTHMSDYEREELEKALLCYCETDTWAMVLLYLGWKEMINE